MKGAAESVEAIFNWYFTNFLANFEWMWRLVGGLWSSLVDQGIQIWNTFDHPAVVLTYVTLGIWLAITSHRRIGNGSRWIRLQNFLSLTLLGPFLLLACLGVGLTLAVILMFFACWIAIGMVAIVVVFYTFFLDLAGSAWHFFPH